MTHDLNIVAENMLLNKELFLDFIKSKLNTSYQCFWERLKSSQEVILSNYESNTWYVDELIKDFKNFCLQNNTNSRVIPSK